MGLLLRATSWRVPSPLVRFPHHCVSSHLSTRTCGSAVYFRTTSQTFPVHASTFGPLPLHEGGEPSLWIQESIQAQCREGEREAAGKGFVPSTRMYLCSSREWIAAVRWILWRDVPGQAGYGCRIMDLRGWKRWVGK